MVGDVRSGRNVEISRAMRSILSPAAGLSRVQCRGNRAAVDDAGKLNERESIPFIWQ